MQRCCGHFPRGVVVYLLLAAGLFIELGDRRVWARMTAGLHGIAAASPSASALAAARRRIRLAPLAQLFDLPSDPAAGNVNRIKMIKRRMCGRVSLDLHASESYPPRDQPESP